MCYDLEIASRVCLPLVPYSTNCLFCILTPFWAMAVCKVKLWLHALSSKSIQNAFRYRRPATCIIFKGRRRKEKIFLCYNSQFPTTRRVARKKSCLMLIKDICNFCLFFVKVAIKSVCQWDRQCSFETGHPFTKKCNSEAVLLYGIVVLSLPNS